MLIDGTVRQHQPQILAEFDKREKKPADLKSEKKINLITHFSSDTVETDSLQRRNLQMLLQVSTELKAIANLTYTKNYL